MMAPRSIRKLSASQAGMAAFMVTTVLILVIGLIIVGFSQTVRRNQRETLDRQLSTQAFYAAETGVNAAKSIVNRSLAGGGSVSSKNSCAPNATYPAIQLSDNTEVSCLLIKTELESLIYSDVTEGRGTVVPVLAADGSSQINEITLTWHTKETDNTTPASGCTGSAANPLPAKGDWSCGYGLLRADVTQFPLSGASIATSGFFMPRNGGAVGSLSYGAQGGLVQGSCSNERCEARITGLSGSSLYMNLRSIYKDAAVEIAARNSSGPVLLGGQVQVDATGKAQDVLRRIQVRVPVVSQNDAPVFAIESNSSICKRFITAPNYYSNDALCSGFEVN